MKSYPYIVILFFGLIFSSCRGQSKNENNQTIKDDRFYIKIVDLKKDQLDFYWTDHLDKKIKTFQHLKEFLATTNDSLLYAINGGMFLKDHSPQGLYIENGKVLKSMDTVQKAFGNFYLQPNGVFAITKTGEAIVLESQKVHTNNLKYATQSGPMLVIDGTMHPAFNEGSKNIHIRNAVGIL